MFYRDERERTLLAPLRGSGATDNGAAEAPAALRVRGIEVRA